MSQRQRQSEINAMRNDMQNLKRQLAEFNSVHHDVRVLQDQMIKENSGLKKWGGILALIAALFAVPMGALNLYGEVNTIFSRPEISLIKSGSLKMNYTPQPKMIGFDFSIAIRNTGNESDVIELVKAKMGGFPFSSSEIHFNRNDISCSENQMEVALPFEVRNNKSRSLQCMIKTNLSSSDVAALQIAGDRHIVVEFISLGGKSYEAHYCIHFSDYIVNEVFKSEIAEMRNFATNYCRQMEAAR